MATVNEKMTAIADAIRDKTGGTETLTLDEMAQAIPDVYYNGHDAGEQLGYNNGCVEGQSVGIELGKQSVYDEFYDIFWDSYQNNGARTDYRLAFKGAMWTDKTFKPKYDFIPTDALQMFVKANITDLVALLESQNVVLDFSKCTNLYGCFSYSPITHIGVIDISNYNNYANLNATFDECRKLVTIDKIKLNSGLPHNISNATFRNCTALQNIKFENSISTSIDFRWSPLSKDSITSVINALSTTTTGNTLTLKKSAVNTAFGIDVDDKTTYPEGSEFYTLRHSKDNWTFSYM